MGRKGKVSGFCLWCADRVNAGQATVGPGLSLGLALTAVAYLLFYLVWILTR